MANPLTDDDPLVDVLLNAVADILIHHGVSRLYALRAAESAISRLIKETACPPTPATPA